MFRRGVSAYLRAAALALVLVALGLLGSVGQPTVIADGNPDTLVPGGTVLPPAPGSGGVVRQAIIGTDDRGQIVTTATPPWRWITYLEIDLDGDDVADAQCTGFLVGEQHVLTAGHCLYDPSTADWSDTIRIVPGKSGASEPFGDQSVTDEDLLVPGGWASGLGAQYDYGLIQLPDETLHNQVGSFGIAVLPDEDLLNAGINLAGYPIDKFPAGSMWSDDNSIKHVAPRIISHEADTFAGQSGSPIWGSDGTYRWVVGIHTYAAGSSSCNPGDNCGTRITAEVADALEGVGVFGRITDYENITCHSLTKSVTPPATGAFVHVPPNSGGCPTNLATPSFAPGTTVGIEAQPLGSHAFSDWDGADDDNANPSIVTMDGPKSVTANFVEDADGDGIGDPTDNCPAWSNPDQVALPWPVPPDDDDCDGFVPAREDHVGTDSLIHCNDDSMPNDEPDAWPPDFNDTQGVNLSDIVLFGPAYNKAEGQGGYNQRFDLNASDNVNLSDVVLVGPYYNLSCTP